MQKCILTGAKLCKMPKVLKSTTRAQAKFIGAHLSVANGLFHAVESTAKIGASAVALFLKNQRTWRCPPLPTDDQLQKFSASCKKHSIDASCHILPHGSYLVNLGNPDKEKRERSYSVFLDDLKRCELYGIGLYNLHPGSTVGECALDESICNIAECINRAHAETDSVTVVLETMAGQGNVVGGRFEHFAQIIELVQKKSRVGVCLDTCHMFAAGYDIRSKESFQKVMDEFGRIVGFQYLKGVHLNDSLGAFSSFKDRHANIGKGLIGLEAFEFIMNSPIFDNIPMVLETPVDKSANDLDIYKTEIDLLYSLHGLS